MQGKFKQYYFKAKDLLSGKRKLGKLIEKSIPNISYVSFWKEANKYLFQDNITDSSFTAKDLNDAREKVKDLREVFRKAKN
jgi:hypothetical protein